MINLALRTEFSFQKTYGFLEDVVATQEKIVGVADIGNTFSHFYLNEECKRTGKKAIFGVRLMVVRDPEAQVKPRGQYGPEFIFIAKNYDGLKEIYALVERYNECQYYRHHVGVVDVWKLSENVIVIAPNFEMEERIDYIGVCNVTSPKLLSRNSDCVYNNFPEIPRIAINNNWIIKPEHWPIYEVFAGSRKKEKFSFPQHILCEAEWMLHFNDRQAIENTYKVADQCEVEFPVSGPVLYRGNKKIRTLCKIGAKKRNINLKDPVYKERFKHEMEMIKKKDFVNYFMIVQEMVNKAKEYSLVGPSRGSSAGSLICYLLGITEVDPIKWGLLFARFIDEHRTDNPDIDVDFPDVKRYKVIKQLIKTNGAENVKNLATISEMKSRGAIGDFAKEMLIDPEEVDVIKNSILVISSGDARFGKAISNTFETTEVGKNFIKKHPQMEIVKDIELHSRHSGTHAAGVLVSAKPLREFGSINIKDNTIQLEGKTAEDMGLLKIDCLGLSTLTVLEGVADLIGMEYKDYYTLPLDDDSVFKIFREIKLRGVFQFEGPALSGLCNSIKVSHIDDIVAITALARPGPLHGGGANKFANIHQGKQEIEYVMRDEDVRKITKSTLGVIVYQEQVMQILREVGGMTWKRVGSVRRIIGKKKGKELIHEFGEEFIQGAVKKGIDREEATVAWKKILEFAAYGFNKSHAVAYGMISYWTAWAKVKYPLEFLVSSLNHSKGPRSALRLIREMKINHKFDLIPIDKELSEEKWIIGGEKIIGPLTNISGIGVKNATVIMRKRETGEKLAAGIQKKMDNPETKFDILYPCDHYWGGLFKSPSRYDLYESPTEIRKVRKKGEYLIVAQLMKKNVRDLNELQNVLKRGGEIYKDNTKLLNIIVEDDTGSLMCRINRFDFDKLGAAQISEDGEEEVDWYLIRGKIISDDIIFFFVSEIYKLGDGYSEGQTIKDI